jgi:hypothetical protein
VRTLESSTQVCGYPVFVTYVQITRERHFGSSAVWGHSNDSVSVIHLCIASLLCLCLWWLIFLFLLVLFFVLFLLLGLRLRRRRLPPII